MLFDKGNLKLKEGKRDISLKSQSDYILIYLLKHSQWSFSNYYAYFSQNLKTCVVYYNIISPGVQWKFTFDLWVGPLK